MDNTTVYTLEPSEEATGKMADSAGCFDEGKKRIIDLCEGNPGALNFLIKLCKDLDPLDYRMLLACFKSKALSGSNLYVFINDDLGYEKSLEMFKAEWLS